MSRRRGLPWLAGLLLAMPLLGGCAGTLAKHITRAPNLDDPARGVAQIPDDLGGADTPGVSARMLAISAELSLRAVIVEPGVPGFNTSRWPWRRGPGWKPQTPIGTVVVLHGAFGSVEAMAEHLALWSNAGFRAIALDLPGHGRSTGGHISFGGQEPQAVKAALAELVRAGTLTRPCLLIGHSLGASTALIVASQGAPVDLVAAISPFARLDEIAPNFTRLAPWWIRWIPLGWRTPGVVVEIGRQRGFDPVASAPVAAIRRLAIPAVLIHGLHDEFVPEGQSEELLQAAGQDLPQGHRPTLLRYTVADDLGHVQDGLRTRQSFPAILRFAAPALHLPLQPLMADGGVRSCPLLGMPLGPTPGAVDMPPPTNLACRRAWAGTPPVRAHTTDAWHQEDERRWRLMPLREGSWSRPAGDRLLLTWPHVPPTWAGRDLAMDLGHVIGGATVWWDGVVVGTLQDRPPVVGEDHRLRIPGYLTAPGHHRLALRVWKAEEGSGVVWTGGCGILRPATP